MIDDEVAIQIAMKSLLERWGCEAQESGFLLLHKPVPNHRLRASIAHRIDAGDKAVA